MTDADTIRELQLALEDERNRLTPGTPERYQGTTVVVRVLALEQALDRLAAAEAQRDTLAKALLDIEWRSRRAVTDKETL